MARFLLVIAGVLATLQSQVAGAVQPCAHSNACAQLSVTSGTGLPGDVVNAEIWFQQGPSDGAPGGIDEIAASALTLSFDAGGADAPLRLADCSENSNGLPNAITPDAALANFNIVVQNARCTGGHTHCVCPDPASGIVPDRFLNFAVYGPVVNLGPTPAVAKLPSGRFLSIAFQIGATAAGTVPLHVYNAWTDSQHPQSTALVSIGDDLQVDQTCAPLAKPPCGTGSVSQLAITDGAIVIIATPTPTTTSTGTATVTASSTATRTSTTTATAAPTNSVTTTPSSSATASSTGTATPSPTLTRTGTATPSGTPTSTFTLTPTRAGSATLSPTPTYTATSSPSPTASQTSTPTHTFTLTPSGTPISTATHAETPTSTPTTESTSTPILTPTLTPSPPRCVGDCNNNHSVTVDEILTMVNIALGNTDISACGAGDANADGQITVDEILTAVNNALKSCSSG